MNHKQKWIKRYIIGCCITVILIILISMANSLAHSIRETAESIVTFTTPKSVQSANDVIEYVEKKYDLEVAVTANKLERSPNGEQRVIYVHTSDPRDIKFAVHVSPTGEIKGDTYEKVKERYQLNKHFNNSQVYEDLAELGFEQMSFNDQANDPPFSIALQDELFTEQALFDVMYEAYPLLQRLSDQAKKLGYSIDSVTLIDAFELSVEEEYTSFDTFKEVFIAEHITFIHRMQERAMKEKINIVQDELDAYNFYMFNVYCTDLEEEQLCETYRIILNARHPEGSSEVGDPLHYDNPEDLERISQAVQLIATVDEAISEVSIQTMLVPEEQTLLTTPQKELAKEQPKPSFISTRILIENIGAIRTVEDINIQY